MKMNKRLINIFEEVCRKNDVIIGKVKNILPVCIVIGKKYQLEIIGMKITEENKDMMRKAIEVKIMTEKPKGYILIFDSFATITNHEKNTREVKEVVIRTLYSREGRKSNYVYHKGMKIIEKLDREFEPQFDQWDFFGNTSNTADEEMKKRFEEHDKFRDEHPELYKD